MSIKKTVTNPYGPATMDLQIEQGCDLQLFLTLTKNGVVWDLSGATFSALFSPTWSPGASEVDMTVTVQIAAAGTVNVTLPGSATVGIGLPSPPKKTSGSYDSRNFPFGGWKFDITQGGITTRLIEGDVTLDRSPEKGG